jgi:light-regulated signal transduction histidine kinase (bacteriophytochrome)
MANHALELLKLHKTIRDLEQKNEELEQFVSHATHDIKEPLRSIAIGSEILLKKYRDKLDNEAVQMLEFMFSSSKRFENIVASLKDYTKADGGKLHIETVDLNKVVGDVLKELNVLINATEAKIKVGDLPVIETDKTKLKLVFQHVIDNALKYRSGNKPDVTINCKKSGTNYTISVTDNGLGIAPHQHERILQPFERLHSKFEIEGMGLGLPVSQKILKRLNGTLKLDSTEGKGTTVVIKLPSKIS